ncbi:6-phosphogluconolactonase [Arcticibacter tournemirensis]|uniref:Lactonase family protein n=1 Tax=Arcticibacter tournemirensis TaxID=699437 RepID=A0A5M9HKG2_9SPHI|nr:lactonase family protein [Arcticibacter tournemirensis]KAA8485914.1 lactonase family protein [Arcticibacter tournemirensis]TQM46828.1 6-phosphogluconolactonase [Arcticibacter tournemirensis]
MKTCNYLFVILLLMSSAALMNQVKAQKLNLLVGTYTDKGTSEGIYVYDFDINSGKASYKNVAKGIDNPSYLAISSDGKLVYAANESGEGTVTAFSFDRKSGALKTLNQQKSNGAAPCYVATNKKGSHVFAGNYSGGNFSVYPVQKDGALGKAVQVIQHSGNGVNKDRQEAPHVHSTVLSPDEKFVMVSDLGTDKINIYHFDGSNVSQPVSPANPPFVSTGAGNGPRHLDFHPNGKYAYSIQEMTGNITVFGYKDGRLNSLQNISMLADDFKGNTGAADIHVSPDGNFLYASNRGDANDIAVFSVNKTTGKLALKGRSSTLGKGPRNFVIDPSGSYLLVGNQNSDLIIIFKRNKESGLLTDTGERIKVGSPVCLKFVE